MNVVEIQRACAVIIVTYNSSAFITRCLESLCPIQNMEIIVVDNNSSDGCAAMIEQRFSSVKLIPLKANMGFGYACNRGVAASSKSCLMFMNPDTIASPHALRHLAAHRRGRRALGRFGLRAAADRGPPRCAGDHSRVDPEDGGRPRRHRAARRYSLIIGRISELSMTTPCYRFGRTGTNT